VSIQFTHARRDEGERNPAKVEPLASRALVTGRTALAVGNASAAIIVLEDGRYLLQLRDDLESIWYPDHWGCFGGGLEPGEDPLAALCRELREELSYEIGEAKFFMELEFDLSGLNLGRYYRKYYVLTMPLAGLPSLDVGEGCAVAAFDGDTVLSSLKVTPYDAFVLFLHARAFRLCKSL
jgi:8-oxo-dGTP pyrophosphatase MutT (NUDIX family)